MSAPTVDLSSGTPRPALARPARWPLAVAVVAALALAATRRFDLVGWCGGGAVVAAFFLGRRMGGRWAGVVASLLVAAGWLIWPVSATLAAALALTLVGAWWATRFADDPAPFNGLVAGTVLGALMLVHRFGVVGSLAAVLFLSSRLRPLWMGWPWVTGALIGWLVARAQPWF